MSIPRNLSIIADTLNANGTFASITDTGNLTFTGTGNRIIGDFSNATAASRVSFQTSTVNGTTIVQAMPNGTGTFGVFRAVGSSDPDNASVLTMQAIQGGTQLVTIRSDITGTGTYLPMTFYTGGSERMRLDTSGNVGIGTSSPSSKLHVFTSSAEISRFNSTATNGGYFAMVPDNATITYIGSQKGILATGNASDFAIVGTGANNMVFGTNSTERMRIDSSGVVGINNSSPSTWATRLTVQGTAAILGNASLTGSNPTYQGSFRLIENPTTIAATGGLEFFTSNFGSGYGWKMASIDSSGVQLTFATRQNSATWSETMRLDSGGNLLLGTTSGSARLVVNGGTSTSQIRWEVNNAAFTQEVSTNAAASAYVYKSNDASYHVWKLSSSEAMRLDSSGNVGIGQTSPQAKLQINTAADGAQIIVVGAQTANEQTLLFRNSYYTNNATGGIAAIGWIDSGSSGGSLTFKTGTNGGGVTNIPSEKMRIDQAGNVGIGTSAPSYKLQVSGAIYQDNGYAQFGNYNAGGANSPIAGGISFSTNATGGQAEGNIWNGNDPALYANTGILFTQRLTSTTRRDLMFLHNNGSVGIGTNSPSQKLDVLNTANAGVAIRINSSNAGSSTFGSFIFGNDADSTVSYIQQNSSGNTTLGGGNSLNIFSKAGAMTFSTGSTERMRIEGGGNVLVGTTTAGAKLTVAGNAATPTSAVTFSATAMTLNCALSNVFTTTFTANVTTAPTLSNPADGQTLNWFITQDATGTRTMTWPTSFKWPGGTAGVLSTAANSVDLLVATYRSATGFWYATLSKGFA